MSAWDIWGSVLKVLLTLLSQLQAPEFLSLTCCWLPTQPLCPVGSPTAEDSHQLCDTLPTSTGLCWPLR